LRFSSPPECRRAFPALQTLRKIRQNGFKISNTDYFVYCNGNTDKEAFDGRLEFNVKIISHKGDTSWVENTIWEAIGCLKSDKLPVPGADCDFCKYRKAISEVTRQFEK
jgi:hypothetical protein